jgi:hypothetical protein
MKKLFIFALLVAGCGGSGNDDSDEALTCSRTDRAGTYLMQFSERAGDCGPIPEQLGRIDDATALPAGCTLDAADRWSDADCTLERAYTCDEPGVGPGVTSSSIAITTQQDQGAESLTGTLSIVVRDSDATQLCRSTYDVTGTRQ